MFVCLFVLCWLLFSNCVWLNWEWIVVFVIGSIKGWWWCFAWSRINLTSHPILNANMLLLNDLHADGFCHFDNLWSKSTTLPCLMKCHDIVTHHEFITMINFVVIVVSCWHVIAVSKSQWSINLMSHASLHLNLWNCYSMVIDHPSSPSSTWIMWDGHVNVNIEIDEIGIVKSPHCIPCNDVHYHWWWEGNGIFPSWFLWLLANISTNIKIQTINVSLLLEWLTKSPRTSCSTKAKWVIGVPFSLIKTYVKKKVFVL